MERWTQAEAKQRVEETAVGLLCSCLPNSPDPSKRPGLETAPFLGSEQGSSLQKGCQLDSKETSSCQGKGLPTVSQPRLPSQTCLSGWERPQDMHSYWKILIHLLKVHVIIWPTAASKETAFVVKLCPWKLKRTSVNLSIFLLLGWIQYLLSDSCTFSTLRSHRRSFYPCREFAW